MSFVLQNNPTQNHILLAPIPSLRKEAMGGQ
jgi:hypothetical protein